MRAAAIIVVLLLVLLPAGPVSAQPATGPTGKCEALSDFLIVAATTYSSVPIFEVQVELRNNSTGRLRVEPQMFAFTSQQTGRIAPLTLDGARAVVQNPTQVLAGLFLFGLLGLFANIESQKRWTAHVETNIFKPADLAPEGTVKGSLFFQPNLSMTQGTLTVDGVKTEAGEALPALSTICAVPTLAGQVAAVAPAVRSYVMTARATSGPITLSVQRVGFASAETVLSVAIENAGEAEANLFAAVADAKLTDETGKSYVVRTLRSTVPERVGPRARVEGRLAFEPLPATVRRATLALPEIRIGDAVHDLKSELRF